MCGAVFDNKIYLFGGYIPLNKPSVNKVENVTNAAYIYDPSTNSYSSLQPMPEPRRSCGAAVLNGYVYVAGGSTDDSNRNTNAMSSVFRYNIQTDQWSTVGSMNNRRDLFKLVELGGLLYAIGHENNVEVYDPSTDRWSFVANRRGGRKSSQIDNINPVVHEGKIYVLDESKLAFEVYSPDTNQWNAFDGPGDYKSRSFVSADGKLWFIGITYYNGHWRFSPAVLSYETSMKQWIKQEHIQFESYTHKLSHVRSLQTFVVNH